MIQTMANFDFHFICFNPTVGDDNTKMLRAGDGFEQICKISREGIHQLISSDK